MKCLRDEIDPTNKDYRDSSLNNERMSKKRRDEDLYGVEMDPLYLEPSEAERFCMGDQLAHGDPLACDFISEDEPVSVNDLLEHLYTKDEVTHELVVKKRVLQKVQREILDLRGRLRNDEPKEEGLDDAIVEELKRLIDISKSKERTISCLLEALKRMRTEQMNALAAMV